jgi:pSer/pThr/pTyr-binding forkhead associated (FHA) protein
MPRLDVYVDFKRFLSLKLAKGGVRVGRSGECDIQLPSEKVSRHHTTIACTPDGAFYIEDRSTNGTRVNAEMVTGTKMLAPGDRIYIDTYILVYQSDETPPETFDDDDQTTFVSTSGELSLPQ